MLKNLKNAYLEGSRDHQAGRVVPVLSIRKRLEKANPKGPKSSVVASSKTFEIFNPEEYHFCQSGKVKFLSNPKKYKIVNPVGS